ncbi:MAG: hypothetical protein ACTSR3_05820 [Candidatus Helarchaeota archaeon]
MKTEKQIKIELEKEIENLSIDTYERSKARFFTDFGFIKALKWVLED